MNTGASAYCNKAFVLIISHNPLTTSATYSVMHKSHLLPRRPGTPSQPHNEQKPVVSFTNNKRYLQGANRLSYPKDVGIHSLGKGEHKSALRISPERPASM